MPVNLPPLNPAQLHSVPGVKLGISSAGVKTPGRKDVLVMELVEGGSLHTLLNDYGSFNETLIRKYVKQILEALAVLKSKHIVHGRIRC